MRLGLLSLFPPLLSMPIAWSGAQGTTAAASFYAEPGGRELATIAKAVLLRPETSAGDFVRVTISGFVATTLLGGSRDSFPVAVNHEGARLRASAGASSAIVAELRSGVGMSLVRKLGDWTEVRRAGWVRKSIFGALPQAATPATSAPGVSPKPVLPSAANAAAPSTASPAGVSSADLLTPVRVAMLSSAPGVSPWATVEHGAPLTPLARERGWVRVRIEGWMREDELTAADSTLIGVTAADLRSSPDEYTGRVVRWTVQLLALQRADAVRRDMKVNEPYFLARGPGDEGALLYLAIPPELVDKAKALIPLSNALITARVRTGKGDPSGVPVLDLISLTKG
jgi:hypothetical protein